MPLSFAMVVLGRAPASQGRHIPGFASLGASHASPLHAAHAPPAPAHTTLCFPKRCVASIRLTQNLVHLEAALFFHKKRPSITFFPFPCFKYLTKSISRKARKEISCKVRKELTLATFNLLTHCPFSFVSLLTDFITFRAFVL